MFYSDETSGPVPEFNSDGLLPRGEVELTVPQLRDSVLVRGPVHSGSTCSWDQSWRRALVANLEVLVGQLTRVGVTNIYIDGSFAEEKDHPNDIDGYFECERKALISGELESRLNQLDPKKSWTWDPAARFPYRGYDKLQLPMWHAYRVELYPHFGQGSGICDRFGNELDFPSAFRISRHSDRPKGIVKIGGLA